MKGFFPDVRDACISPCGVYRYWLYRRWGPLLGGVVCFVMLNPSKADAKRNDPTVIRCIGFAKRWGYDSLYVLNLFSYRSTEPKKILLADDPVGPDGNAVFRRICRRADRFIAAWGSFVPYNRDKAVLKLLPKNRLFCLGKTKNGSPRHPLYVRADQELIPYAGGTFR